MEMPRQTWTIAFYRYVSQVDLLYSRQNSLKIRSDGRRGRSGIVTGLHSIVDPKEHGSERCPQDTVAVAYQGHR